MDRVAALAASAIPNMLLAQFSLCLALASAEAAKLSKPALSRATPFEATSASIAPTAPRDAAKLLVKNSARGATPSARKPKKIVDSSTIFAPKASILSAAVGTVVLIALNLRVPSSITPLTKAWRRSYSVSSLAVLPIAAA